MYDDLRLDHRHIILLFIAGVTLCVIFFFFGLFVGKYTAGQPMTATITQPETLPAEESTPSEEPVAQDTNTSDVSASQLPAGPASNKPAEIAQSPAGSPPPSTNLGGPNATAPSTTPPVQPATDQAAEKADPGQALSEPTAFLVQAGMFESSNEAENFAATLRARGFVSAHTKYERSGTGSAAYYVMLGPYLDRQTATEAMTELRNSGVTDVRIVGER
jgi:cell division protein FtsN